MPLICCLSVVPLCHMLLRSVLRRVMPVGLLLRVLLCVSRAHSLLLRPSWLVDGTAHIEVDSSDVIQIYTHSKHLHVHTYHSPTHTLVAIDTLRL